MPRNIFGGGNGEINWERMLYSTVGGILGGVGGTMTNILGVPIGLGGHIATEYFADEERWDDLGKGISNGFIGGGIGSFMMTTTAQELGNRRLTTENIAQHGSGSLMNSLTSPSVYVYEKLTQMVGEAQDRMTVPSTVPTPSAEEYFGYIE